MLRFLRGMALLLGVVVLVAAAIMVWLVMTTPAPESREGWRLGAELPQPFGELATVALPLEDGGESLVVLSGIAGFGRVVDDVWTFDQVSGSWNRGPSLPAPRHHAAAAVLDGAVVISGGAESLEGRPWQGTRTVWRWTPGGSWEAMPSLPEARWGHRMVEHGGRLYVVGGFGDSGSTFVYRPDHDGWAVGAPIPQPRDHLSVVVVDDRIWAIGGRAPHSLARVDIYDPGEDRWTAGPDLPAPTSGAAEGVVDGRIYIFGGEEPDLLRGGVFDRHWVLDTTAADAGWQQAPKPPLAVHGADGAVFDGRMVLVGGASRHGLSSVIAWTPAFQIMDP